MCSREDNTNWFWQRDFYKVSHDFLKLQKALLLCKIFLKHKICFMSNTEYYAECLKHAQWVDRQIKLFFANQLKNADFKVDTPFNVKKTRAKLAALKLDAEQQLEHARKCLWVQTNKA